MQGGARWTTLLWDWDGTLADTVPAIVAAHHEATERVLARRLDEDRIRARIGEPARRRIHQLVGPEQAHDVFAVYAEIIAAVPPAATTVFPGIAALVAAAADAGCTNVIVTSRPRRLVLPVLELLGLDGCFRGTIGLEDTAEHKPSAEPLLAGAALAAAPPASCVYVGDAVVDRLAAAAAGTSSVAVTWGAGEADVLAGVHPDHVVTSVAELWHVLLGEAGTEGSGF